MTKPVQNIADAVISMFRREGGKQHLFTKDTLDAAVLSLSAFYKSATHPYVVDKTQKYVCLMHFRVVAWQSATDDAAADVQSLSSFWC